MADQSPAPGPALSFGGVAEAYDRGRPTYPVQAAGWLAGAEPRSVLELGAGTGKLTERLVELGHDVHATDPDSAMLEVLRRRLPRVRTTAAAAEELPVPDRSVDVVVCGQAFHWFDLDRAVPEIARVLRPRGRVALVWNQQDTRIPWVRRLVALLGHAGERDPEEALTGSGLFGPVEEASFKHWQVVDRESVRDLALSRSAVATLGAEEQADRLAEVVALYDEYGRGMDGMQVPYAARCFRATVVDRVDGAKPPAEDVTPAPDGGPRTEPDGPVASPEEPRDPATDPVSDGTDTDMLLIDFR
ncbi:class I SAM-dependent methyltransferase [Nocardioides sp. SYSU DS0663]|uniref:class I SAM-dependent methyltransferase n=1 Tax=Nocardioides sp. SYSU DS0663 TaxID=3416445 RepID=UPI003F4B72D6